MKKEKIIKILNYILFSSVFIWWMKKKSQLRIKKVKMWINIMKIYKIFLMIKKIKMRKIIIIIITIIIIIIKKKKRLIFLAKIFLLLIMLALISLNLYQN
jgi:hypothetical protein